MPPSSRSLYWFMPAWGVAVVLALGTLPYLVPLTPNFSDSYLFGYSNRAGLAIVAVFGLVIAAFAPWFAMPAGSASPSRLLGRSTLWKALVATFVFGVTIYLLTRRLGGIDESVYQIDRVKLLLEGHIPNRDFEWPYGLFLLYGSALMARWFHLPVTDAYNIFWILLTLTGVWMLYATLRAISDPALPLRRTFLVVLAMVWRSMLCTGVNYTLFRFILPCFLALTIDRRLRGGNAVRAMLLIAPCYAALLLVSPEMALSFAMGLTVYVALFWAPRGRAQIVAALGSLALIAAITWFAAQHGTFLILSAFSTGGFNFPIMPAPHILVFLLSIALCAAYVGRQFRARRPTPLVLLIAVSAASVAGALGRCDAGHVFLDPLGITIAALLLGSTTSRAGRVYFAAVITFFIVLPGALTLVMLRTTPRLAAQPNAGLQVPDVDHRFGLPAGTTVEVPFGISTSRFGTLHSPQIDQGYYLGLLGALTPAAVENKVAELAQHPARPLLLPEHYEDNCRIDAKMHRRFLSIVFLYPYDARVRHTESIYEPLCATIAQHYRLEQPATPEHFDYEVWQPR